MPHIRQIDGATRVAFESDKLPNERFRFYSATTGFKFIAEFGTSASTSTAGGTGTIVLPFEYFVGKHQLLVSLVDPTDGSRTLIMNEDDYNDAVTAGDVVTAISNGAYVYREITKDSIEVDVVGAGAITTEIFEVMVPHTSIPGISQDRVVVENQADDIAVQFRGPGDGIEMVAPDGTVWIMTITAGGGVLVRPKS